MPAFRKRQGLELQTLQIGGQAQGTAGSRTLRSQHPALLVPSLPRRLAAGALQPRHDRTSLHQGMCLRNKPESLWQESIGMQFVCGARHFMSAQKKMEDLSSRHVQSKWTTPGQHCEARLHRGKPYGQKRRIQAQRIALQMGIPKQGFCDGVTMFHVRLPDTTVRKRHVLPDTPLHPLGIWNCLVCACQIHFEYQRCVDP